MDKDAIFSQDRVEETGNENLDSGPLCVGMPGGRSGDGIGCLEQCLPDQPGVLSPEKGDEQLLPTSGGSLFRTLLYELCSAGPGAVSGALSANIVLDQLRATLLLPAGHGLSDPELLRGRHHVPDELLLRTGDHLHVSLLLRSLHVHFPAGGHPVHFVSAQGPAMPGAKLGAALLPGAGDDLPEVVLLGTG